MLCVEGHLNKGSITPPEIAPRRANTRGKEPSKTYIQQLPCAKMAASSMHASLTFARIGQNSRLATPSTHGEAQGAAREVPHLRTMFGFELTISLGLHPATPMT